MKKKKKTIIIYIDNIERYRFFRRVGNAIEALGYEAHYLTPRLSIYGLLLIKRKKVYCLKYVSGAEDITTKNISESIHVLANYHRLDKAKRIYGSVLKDVDKIFHKNSVDLIFIWNGSSTMSMALKSYAEKNRIGCRFFEISNLGAKIFVDTEGVNAQSYLYRHPEVLDRFGEINDEEWRSWKNEYENNKDIPRQAILKNKIPLILSVDVFGFLFGCIKEDDRNPFAVIWNKLTTKHHKCLGEIVDISQIKFCFLPLQVSNDTQLLINSGYSNEELIEEAEKYCVKNGYELVIKIHPAEQNKMFVSAVFGMQKVHNFIIACNDTKELIQKSELLLVNNSTVGLEAMILGKPVKIYGKAIYNSFDKKRMRAYVLKYLVDMNYFSNSETIDRDEVEKIIAMDRWGCFER